MSTASRPVAVVSAADRERFCAVPGFSRLSRAALDRQRPDALWLLAGNDGTVRARCALWWKNAPIHEENRVGLIGHYAARDAEAAAEILNLASSQLSEHGCALAVGPMDGSTWQNYRLVVERGSEAPFFMEPDNPDD